LVGDHPGIIPVKFSQNPTSSCQRRCLSKSVDGRRMTDKGRAQNVSLKHNGIFVFQQLFVF